jgi:hypothetical protein
MKKGSKRFQHFIVVLYGIIVGGMETQIIGLISLFSVFLEKSYLK